MEISNDTSRGGEGASGSHGGSPHSPGPGHAPRPDGGTSRPDGAPHNGAPGQPGGDPPAQEDTKRASYRSGFAFGTLGFFSVAAIGVVSTIVTARMYGVRVIGEFALVWAPVAALWNLSTIKEQQALIKEITGLPRRHPRVTQLFGAVFTFSIALTLTIALIDAVVCWFVFKGPLHAPGLLAPAYANIAGCAIVANTGWNVDSIFSAFVAGRQLFWVRLHENLSFLAIAIAVGLVWQSVWGLVIATVGSAFTALVHRLVWVRPFIRARLTREEYRLGLGVLPELLRFGLKATPGQIAQAASQQGGVWALGIVAPVVVVGAYSRAQTIPQRLQQASMRITEVLYPTLVGRHKQGDGEGFDRALIDSIRYEVIGMLLIAAIIGGAAHTILEIFGPGFGRATTALALLVIFPAMASVTVTQTQALWATDRPGLTSVIAIARLAVSIVLLVVLTPRLGIVGPAIALLAGYAVVIVLGGMALRPSLSRPLGATWPLLERFALVAAYAAGFLGAKLVEHVWSSIAAVPLSLAAGTVAYAAVFVILGGVNERDRKRLRDALVMLRSRRGARAATPATASQGGG